MPRPRPRHLTFANVASASALAIALAGGGVAAAAGLAANSVGSAQIKTGAVKSADVKNNNLKGKDVKDDSLTGKDVNESSLGKVPSAASVDTVSTKRVTANPGQTVPIATNTTLVVELTCIDNGGGDIDAQLNLRTTADNAAFDANIDGDDDGDLDIADGPIDIATEGGTAQEIEDGGYSAVTAAGVSWKGYGWVMVHLAGANTCTAEMTFLG